MRLELWQRGKNLTFCFSAISYAPYAISCLEKAIGESPVESDIMSVGVSIKSHTFSAAGCSNANMESISFVHLDLITAIVDIPYVCSQYYTEYSRRLSLVATICTALASFVVARYISRVLQNQESVMSDGQSAIEKCKTRNTISPEGQRP